MIYMSCPAYVRHDGDNMVFYFRGREVSIPIEIFDVVAYKRCEQVGNMAHHISEIEAKWDLEAKISLQSVIDEQKYPKY